MAQNSLMADSSDAVDRPPPRKKQKTASGARGVERRKALGTSPFKTRRKRLARRISSQHSSQQGSQESQPSKTPIFRQPQQRRHPSPLSSRPPHTRNAGDITKRPAIDGEEEEEDDDDDEEEEEEEVIGGAMKEGLTKYMRRLTTDKRYVALGKSFALKYWPWPSYNWWVDKDDVGGMEVSPSECKLKAESEFPLYLEMLSIGESEWMRGSFRTPVIIFAYVLKSILIAS